MAYYEVRKRNETNESSVMRLLSNKSSNIVFTLAVTFPCL